MLTDPQTAIILFVYKRPKHTSATIQALRSCEGIEDYPLYIFCDGPKGESDRNLVMASREAIAGLHWPSQLVLEFAENNKGLASSIISGVSKVLSMHDSAIVLEDDIVFAGSALRYFSLALSRYRQSWPVASISGFSLPSNLLKIPKDYPYDAYFLGRNSSWGWATWKDRWDKVRWDIKLWREVRSDHYFFRQLRRNGPDLPKMLDAQEKGLIDSWAVKFTLNHFIHGWVSLIPVHSYVHNIGLDGSGIHCGKTDSLMNDLALAKRTPVFPTSISIDPLISRRFASFFRRGELVSHFSSIIKGLCWKP